MPLAVICPYITEINEVLMFTIHFQLSLGDDMENDLEELANLYIIKNEEDKILQRRCTLCGKVFRDMYNAKMHLDSKHFPAVNGYSCDICNKKCKSKAALSSHLTLYHRKK